MKDLIKRKIHHLDGSPGDSTLPTLQLSEATASAQAPAPASAQSTYTQAYLGFLARVATVDADTTFSPNQGLDPKEKALLEVVLLHWSQHLPLTVRQTIAFAHLGSPATLHKRLMRLRARRYLQLQDVADDKRAKHLVPGIIGVAYLEQMGKHLLAVRRAPFIPQ